MATVFEELNSINVNDKTEKKVSGGTELTYLSWPFAWSEVKKRYPDASYEIIKENGLPYAYDERTGYMVFTEVTIEGVSHMMWLPVMDNNNRAMKSEPYTVSFKSGKSVEVAPATMFDINKTIMRCLVKNLAMFGLGLYIYAGEDIPQPEKEEFDAKKKADQLALINKVIHECTEKEISLPYVCHLYRVTSIRDLTEKQCENVLNNLDKIKEKENQANE